MSYTRISAQQAPSITSCIFLIITIIIVFIFANDNGHQNHVAYVECYNANHIDDHIKQALIDEQRVDAGDNRYNDSKRKSGRITRQTSLNANKTILSPAATTTTATSQQNNNITQKQKPNIHAPSHEEMVTLLETQIIVRLNVVVDPTFAMQFNNNLQRIQDVVWAIFFETQLYFDRPELKQGKYKYIRFAFVIVSLQVSEKLLPSQRITDFSDAFNKTKEVQDHYNDADLHVLLSYRNYFVRNKGQFQISVVQGFAYHETFCTPLNYDYPPVAVITIRGFPNAMTIAHEFAHAFGLPHDGFPRDPPNPYFDSRRCKKNSYTVMAENAFYYGPLWSECSVRGLTMVPYMRFNCILDPKRIGNIKPVEKRFDWRKYNHENISQWPDLLPGEKFSQLEQCQLMLGPSSFPVGRIGEFDICQDLTCDVGRDSKDRYVRVFLGPPLTGTECQFENYTGKCYNQLCY